jgi:hypothetical protein
MPLETRHPKIIGEIHPLPQFMVINSINNALIPLPPLITARFINEGSEILTRITLLVDADVTEVTLHNMLIVNLDILSYSYVYMRANETLPSRVNLWYAEVTFPSRDIKYVQVNLHDGDPETSRGTMTTVQES